METAFTEIYLRNLWGNLESRSGPTSTLERSRELRESLPELIKSLGIESILDCGCGDWNWMRTVDLTISYIGVDIVNSLIETLQSTYSKDNVVFQKMDVTKDPPETADLWLARDLLGVLDYNGIRGFIEKFLESKSLYLAVTSVETEQENTDGLPGIRRPIDIFMPPFMINDAIKIVYDGNEWFRRRLLLVYTRESILEWWQQSPLMTKTEESQENKVDGTQDRNAHLKSNISLKAYPTHGHIV